MSELEELESTGEHFDAGDRKKVNERNSKLGREREAEQNYLKIVLSTAEGRKWIYNLLETCALLEDTAVGNDPYLTFKKSGRQDVGRKLMIDIEVADSDKLSLMMKEARERKENEIRKNHPRKTNREEA